jgi:hypothetical protein
VTAVRLFRPCGVKPNVTCRADNRRGSNQQRETRVHRKFVRAGGFTLLELLVVMNR